MASIYKPQIHTLKWSIPDFMNLTQNQSKLFDLNPQDIITFGLSVYPLGQQIHSWFKDDLLVKVFCRRRFHCSPVELPVAIKISIIDFNQHKCCTQDYQWKFNDLNGNFVAKFVSREFLIKSANQMMPDGVLTLFGEVKIGSKPNLKRPSEVLDDYESLLKSGDFSDVSLIVGSTEEGGEIKEFSAHKAILSARSEVFAAMFKHSNTREAQESRVDIPDVRVPVFELFLQYIYTGKNDISSLNSDHASELFEVADKYQISSLKQNCEQHLCENIDIESLAQTLLLADMHEASKLKSKCIKFFVENGDQVMKTEGWTKISNKPDLLDDLVKRFDDYKQQQIEIT